MHEIMRGFSCPKNFICYTSGFKTLCKARDVGLQSYVACMMKDPMGCKFSLLFDSVYFCTCSLRIFIAKNFKK